MCLSPQSYQNHPYNQTFDKTSHMCRQHLDNRRPRIDVCVHLTQVLQWRGIRGLFLWWPAAGLWHAELWQTGQDFLQCFHWPVGPGQEDRIWSLRWHHQVWIMHLLQVVVHTPSWKKLGVSFKACSSCQTDLYPCFPCNEKEPSGPFYVVSANLIKKLSWARKTDMKVKVIHYRTQLSIQRYIADFLLAYVNTHYIQYMGQGDTGVSSF